MTKPVVVMKFGGTSVATEEGRFALAQRIKKVQSEDKLPVVVVSAMGRKGMPYATDTLLGLVQDFPQSERENDALASVGEIISSIVVAGGLRARGIDALALTGPDCGIYATDTAQNAVITEIHTHKILGILRDGGVPIVCGFQAISQDSGAIVTLGRGGSDTTACALGVSLNAEAVEIYSDVDGVMTADPRIVKDARVVGTIRADELYQMAQMGSKIVHTPAAELALKSGVALYVKNTYTEHEGTCVVDMASYRPGAVATAVVHTHDVSRFIVNLATAEGCSNHLKNQTAIYNALAENCISLDMFTPADSKLLFTVASSSTKRAEKCLADLGFSYRLSTQLSKVTLIGAGMHGVVGVIAKISTSLLSENIDIYQVTDSNTTISVLVASVDCDRAVAALHSTFNLGATHA
ncbi:MAG: aspartate kinase [Coriobacteriia bacterium]|nr:aspartate kinase [Coriobacteriia bacterium]